MIDRLVALAQADQRRIFGPDGQVLPPDTWPEDVAQSVSQVSVSGHRITVKFFDRIRALELLGRHLGLFTERVESVVRLADLDDAVLATLSDEELAELQAAVETIVRIGQLRPAAKKTRTIKPSSAELASAVAHRLQ